MLARQMAIDYSCDNIRMNALYLGFIRTPELEHYLGRKPATYMARADVVA